MDISNTCKNLLFARILTIEHHRESNGHLDKYPSEWAIKSHWGRPFHALALLQDIFGCVETINQYEIIDTIQL